VSREEYFFEGLKIQINTFSRERATIIQKLGIEGPEFFAKLLFDWNDFKEKTLKHQLSKKRRLFCTHEALIILCS
jgi:hypothetical protein